MYLTGNSSDWAPVFQPALQPLEEGRTIEITIGPFLPCEGDPALVKPVFITSSPMS